MAHGGAGRPAYIRPAITGAAMAALVAGMLTGAPSTVASAKVLDGLPDFDETVVPGGEGIPLPLDGFHEIVADTRHDRLFVSGTPRWDPLLVLDRDGKVVQKVPGSEGTQGLALSPDGNTLYATIPVKQRIGVLDTETLEYTTYPIDQSVTPGVDTNPGDAAVADGVVWFNTGSGGLAGWDIETHETYAPVVPMHQNARLISVPGRPHQLIVQSGTGSDGAARVVVHGGPHPRGRFAVDRHLVGGKSSAVMPDGSAVLTMGYRGAQLLGLRRFDARDLYAVKSPFGTYNPGAAVAVRHDGMVAVASKDEYDGAYLRTYHPGRTAVAREYVLDPDHAYYPHGYYPASQGLAFGRSRLYAVVVDDLDTRPTVFVLERPGEVVPEPPTPKGLQSVLPFQHFGDIAVTPRTRRVFISGGPRENGVVVTDLRGRRPALLEHLPGADHLEVSRDGRRVYVALSRGDGIAVIDARTLRVRRYLTRVGDRPMSLTAVGRHIYLSNSTAVDPSSTLRRLDLATGRTQVLKVPAAGLDLWPAPPGAEPSTRYVTDNDIQRWTLPASGQPRARGGAYAGDTLVEVATTPDGLHLLVRDESGAGEAVFTTGLDPVGLLTQVTPSAVAVRDDGLVASAVGKPEFHDNNNRDRVTFWRGWSGPYVRDRGLRHYQVFSGGVTFAGRHLLAASRVAGRYSSRVGLKLLPAPTLRRLTVSSDRWAYQADDRAQVVAHVAHVGDRDRPRPVVSLWARTADRPRRLIARGRPDAFGNLEAHLRVHRRTRVVATAAGRESWRGAAVLRVRKQEGLVVVPELDVSPIWLVPIVE